MRQLQKVYAALSITQKSVIWYTLATIIQNGILFLTTPLYTRILTDEQYGVFSVYQSWQQIVSILAVLSLDRCITVGFMKFQEERKEFLSSVQGLMSVLVLGFALITAFFALKLERMLGLPVCIIFTMLIVALMNNTLANWSWFQRYQYKYVKLTIVTIAGTVMMQLAAVLAILFWPKSNKGEIFVLAMSAVRVLLYGIIYVSVFVNGKRIYNKEHWRFALGYSVAVLPHALAQIILNSSDRIMIDIMCGREAAAYYGVTYTAAMVLNIILTAVSSALQPWFFEKIKEKDFDGIRKQTNAALTLAGCLVVAASAFAPEVLSIMAPASYKAALRVFPSVAAGIFFNSIYLYFANFESYYEKPMYFSIATTTGAVINIVLNYLLIPQYGLMAAGYTTLFCYMLFAFMHYVFMKKVCHEKLEGEKIFDMKYILALSLAVILSSIGVTVLYS